MRLYDFWSSSAAYRVRIALGLKGLAWERVVINRLNGVEDPGYHAVNPQGFVPTLEVDGRRLVQSLAILEYLDERWPEPPLLPRTPEGRARVRGIAGVVACDIQPLNNQRVQDALLAEFGLDSAGLRRWYALDRRGAGCARAAAAGQPGDRHVLPRRGADPGRRVPRAAAVQRPALGLRSGALPDGPAHRRGLPGARGVPGRGTGAAGRLPR
jgi:glutathione S-transferase